MEEAKLVNIRKSKKGKIVGQIQFSDGKKMSIPAGALIEESLNNTKCEVKRKDGSVVSIMVEGKEIYKRISSESKVKSNTVQHKNRFRNRGGRSSNYQRKTTPSMRVSKAPYNFIPLNDNDKVVQGQKRPDSDCYYKQDNVNGLRRFNGYVDCKLETITPLYIRDTYTAEELKKKEDSNKDNPEFFSPAGAIRIPGSSLRGMTRTLVEIMSWGKFGPFEDKRLFYRGLADISNLEREYQNNMSSYDRETRKSTYKFNAGYLKKEGFNYYIIPGKVENGKQFRQIAKRDNDESFVVERQNDGKYLVISGNIGNKKHDWLINEPDFKQKIPVSEIDVKEYILDENRYEDKNKKDSKEKCDGNLLRLISISKDKMTPCFYVLWKDDKGRERVSFGHTGYFRLAFQYTIGDHIPAELKKEEITDMAEAIFGKVSKVSKDDTFASRVFFEDAFLEPGQSNVYLSEQPLTPKILSNPKPTTFQHYLEQDPNCSQRSLNHWNNQGKSIRGNKLYWHRKASDWKFEGDKRKSEKQLTSIKPVKANTKFMFKIRFENLSEAELGAILFALDLPKGHYHKLGMGKPLGLGSVKIMPTLFIIDRESRYNRLFNGEKWHLGIEQVETKEFKEAFEKYVLENINSSVPLWDHKRMKQLKTMLDWSNTEINGWHEETEYLALSEFKKRQVLPRPIEVKDKFSKD
ncbi:MAG: TIGR03986 family CRISPR-associated RAMP protein [Firmicutes bacterium]|nr:TIGR03986 family CRISPR-associated RAMP protein [Bacillota bacterium]